MIDLPVVDLTRWQLRDPKVTYEWEDHELQITVQATVRNVETGEDGPLIQRRVMSRYDLQRKPALVHEMLKQHIKHMVMDMLMHELSECLYFDGVRLCADPHPERKFLITGILFDDAGQPPRT